MRLKQIKSEEALSLTFIKMRKDIEKIIKIVDGVSVSVSDGMVSVKSGGKELSRKFDTPNIKIIVDGDSVKVSAPRADKRDLKMIGTTVAHISNMIKGVKEEFVYELEICNVHFPMNVKSDGKKVVIKSFLGETHDRIAKIIPGAKVEVSGTKIVVSGSDREAAGQTAANLEKATRLTGRDRRVFQDGIYITNKCGRAI